MVLIVATVVDVVGGEGAVVDVVGGGGSVELVVGTGGFVVDELVDVVEAAGIVGPGAVLVDPTGSGACVVVVSDVLVVAPVLLVTRVLLVTLVLVGPVPGGRVLVVLVATIGAGHAPGAGAWRATKRPGLSLPILPPKSRQ